MGKKQNITDIFVRGRKLTLGIKLVGTFAITYYSVASLDFITEAFMTLYILVRPCFKRC